MSEADVLAEQFAVMEAVNAPLSAWETFSKDLTQTVQDRESTLAHGAEALALLAELLERVNLKISQLKTQ